MSTITDQRTLTDLALAAEADRIVHAARAMDRPWSSEPDLVVAWQGDRGLFTNVAIVLEAPGEWQEVLDRIERVVPLGTPVSIITAATTPDLTDHGWFLIGHPPLMVRPAAEPPADAPSELTIEEVIGEGSLEEFERTLAEGYPEPNLLPYRWGDVYDGRVLGGASHFFIGRVGGAPVATAVGHVAHGVNLVEMVATHESARNRGYGAALTAVASTIDASLPAVLIASDPGRPVYERLGFFATSRWTFWHRPA